ncbi:MAG: hypothetical protein AAB511_03625 [Patescibacteria group bacterium]
MPSKPQLLQTTKILILALSLSLGLSYVFAWTGPSQTAPLSNVPAPINVGPTAQTKLGQLLLAPATLPAGQAAFDVTGIASVNGILVNGAITITGGSPATGKVLTAVDGTGFARWEVGTAASTVAPGNICGAASMLPVPAGGQAMYETWGCTNPVSVLIAANTTSGVIPRTYSCTNGARKVYTDNQVNAFVCVYEGNVPGTGSGTWCGSGYVRTGNAFLSAGTFLKTACQGVNPATSCPTGYTQTMYSYTYATNADQVSNARSSMYTCTKN